jgi:Flp pilus assembly protein TadD
MRDLGRQEEANGFRILSLETRKKDPFFNAFLAEEAFAEGRMGDALELIRTAIKLSPHEPELYLAEAQFRLNQGQPDEARKSLEKARKWALPQERERFDNKLAMLAKR